MLHDQNKKGTLTSMARCADLQVTAQAVFVFIRKNELLLIHGLLKLQRVQQHPSIRINKIVVWLFSGDEWKQMLLNRRRILFKISHQVLAYLFSRLLFAV